jgi:hypothetical protein
MYRGGHSTQHAVRGNTSWRDRGKGHSSHRGGSNSIRKPQPQLWSRQESSLSSTSPIDVVAMKHSMTPASVSAPACASSRASKTNISDAIPTRGQLPAHFPLPAVPTYGISEPQNWSRPESNTSIDIDSLEPTLLTSVPAPPTHSRTSTTNKSAIRTINRSPTPPSILAFSMHTISEPQTSRTAHIPQWLLRSRSPSPKLPPTPLKRRKLDSDDERPSSGQPIPSRLSEPTIESIPAPTLRPTLPRPRIPLPARAVKQPTPSTPVRHPTPPIHVKEGKFSSGNVTRDSEPGPSVKPERRSPSLPLLIEPERKLIRQSAKFFPMPASCRKSNPQFAEERRSYFRQQCKELLKLGLKKTKAFWRCVYLLHYVICSHYGFRDDGLVIEW